MLYAERDGNWIKIPAPDELSINNELIWSSNTGRSSTGLMIGDVIAEKNTFGISWRGLRNADEYKKIKEVFVPGFFKIQIILDETIEITAYRGTISARARGKIGDTYYYDSISVDIVEQ